MGNDGARRFSVKRKHVKGLTLFIAFYFLVFFRFFVWLASLASLPLRPRDSRALRSLFLSRALKNREAVESPRGFGARLAMASLLWSFLSKTTLTRYLSQYSHGSFKLIWSGIPCFLSSIYKPQIRRHKNWCYTEPFLRLFLCL